MQAHFGLPPVSDTVIKWVAGSALYALVIAFLLAVAVLVRRTGRLHMPAAT